MVRWKRISLEGQESRHAEQTRGEAGAALISETIDGKVEGVEAGQALEAVGEEAKVTIAHVAALKPE